ncbi:hypothetical protein NGB36_01625 [Streptomyces sp. RB6PN25]|uniref:Thioredoxin n=1 Tax=Streptomyces humicola TaxID=2953240 RepID=A0ABT1PNT4_9ACTN|nr:hypothetical protein [Streptomyces humicola]MCQ4079338.1 hypothetical protein [Streptomyces humicola]
MSPEQTARRLEEILDRLSETGDPATVAAANELVRVLMDFYGAGLARIVDLITGHRTRGEDDRLLAEVLDDELLAGFLVLHGLHPQDTMTRIARALDATPGRPFETVGFDAESGTLRLRRAVGSGSGCGCQKTAQAAREKAEAALACLAPEVTEVRLDQEDAAGPEPVLLQIASGPPRRGTAADAAPTECS